MNRSGMLAMFDAMIFATVIIIASATLIHGTGADRPDDDPGEALQALMTSKVRMSDMIDGGDGSIVRVCDAVASEMMNGTGHSLDYLRESLDIVCGGRPYTLRLHFGDADSTIGMTGQRELASSSMDFLVTTGGTVHAELTLYSS